MKKRLAAFIILILFVLSIPVYAGAPMTTVQASVNRVLDVLRDAKLKSPAAKEKKKEKLRVIYKDMFDEKFSGLIIKKHLNKDNRMSPTFKLKDFSEVFGYSTLWEKAEVGDSLAKKASSRFVKILKKDTTIVLDMNVAFRYHDTFPENKE